jgi:hypothetical protein
MTTTKNQRTAYAIFGTDFSGLRHHLGDAVATTAYDAWLGAQQEHGERWHDLSVDPIKLADIDDDDLRQAMAEWMDRNGVESR